ncbi:hypothetical protein [Tabrizicola sp.]|uniref:hypothetical protein n=1 Tax=Tabrizicola sp. TaxID=2005166 RepID=UPI002FDE061C
MPHRPDRRSVLAGLAALPALSGAGLAGPVEQPFSLRVIMSGHSLTDPIPAPLARMVAAAGGLQDPPIENSTVPGSTMKYRWQPDSPMVIDARRIIGDYDRLILTERVPVRSAITWEETEKYALTWFEHAWKHGNGGRGAETILYASWVGIGSGPGNTDPYDMPDEGQIPFRERLDLELGSWREVVAFVNGKRPKGSPRMRLIPGPKIMASIFDAIAAGTAPGLTAMQDLFEDNIHPNRKGAYPIALAHFAVIYGRNPQSVPTLRGEEGWPSPDQQDWMKSLVWDVLRNDPDSGLA